VALNSTVTGTFTWTAAIYYPSGGTITSFSNGSANTITQILSNTGTTAEVFAIPLLQLQILAQERSLRNH
jgi:hypothetical protein